MSAFVGIAAKRQAVIKPAILNEVIVFIDLKFK
jgi:hypothetical protein